MRLKAQRQGAGHRQGGRREDRHRPGARDRRAPQDLAGLPARRGAGRRDHQPRLGAGDEDRRRHRHRPRRPHLPRRHRRARARRAGGRRRRGCDRQAAARASVVTVSCAEGEIGRVYDGDVPFEVDAPSTWRRCDRPRTQIMVNLGNPDLAFRTAMMPNDGVGLARMEFIISEHIGIHPMALVHPEKVTSAAERERIAQLTPSYASPARILRRDAGRGRRHDRGGVLSQAGDRPAVRLQDQRICAACSAAPLRAEGGQSDARLPRRLALCPPGLRRRLRAGMRGAAPRARGDGADQSARHGAVLPTGRGGASG